MTAVPYSERARAALATISEINRYFEESELARRLSDPAVCDFTIGNPHELPMPGYAEALKRHVEPRDRYWYAYKTTETGPRAALAESLRAWRGVRFEEKDLFLTNGATAALNVVLNVIVGSGDEVIFPSPPWFQYEGMIIAAGGAPVRVRVNAKTFDLDLEAISRAISPRTRAIIVNSPHNPTGKIYPPDTLKALASLLHNAKGRTGRPVYLVSDESYSRIIFDHRVYHSPTSFYPHSFLVYTYGKVLLTPGQRIGYIALPPEMPEREELRQAIFGFQMLAGWAFPNALMQHAFKDLDRLSLDLGRLQRRRDRMVSALRAMGYETTMPEGTFYVLVRSPIPDDDAFVRSLIRRNIFCIPGKLMDLPGFFRISLTANDEMVERALPGFAAALKETSGP